MFPTPRLDTPPPVSRFRRPWSPEPFDPNPPRSVEGSAPYTTHGFQPRREPTDVSVEALDLAEFTRSLARTSNNGGAPVFQPAFEAYASYPPSPQSLRPLAGYDSLASPPVLSPSSSTSHSSRSSAPLRPHRRPFSLPPPVSSPLQRYNALATPPPLSLSSRSNHPALYDNDPLLTPPDFEQEIDISQFPKFARHWYKNPRTEYFDSRPPYTSPEPDPFDPAYEHASFPTLPPYQSAHASSHASRSARDLVPWGPEPADDTPVTAEMKAERMRILEREFGGKNDKEEVGEEHRVGSVDAKGRLITEGPKKRTAVRCVEVLLALLAAGSGIYSAAFIKTSSPPPPAGRPQAYALYVISVVTFLITTWLFLIQPTCCARRPHKASGPFTEGPGGMMVLPVPGMPGGKKAKTGKKGKNAGENVQVNLIVDPGLFGGRREDEHSEDDGDTESDYTIPGSFGSRSRGRHRRRGRRRGVFAGLALEAEWKEARKRLKWNTAADAVMFLVWGALFVYILLGKRCPSGSFDGWCDAYNLATASSCILSFAFGLSIFFDVKDLHASKASPRTRT
ncbi:hypothetical protein PHLGIDRAFT_32902 [Phlebiopsis gigantea 11061_1 CR5-6]|uniref:Uncharacterized protein n=1 Tax=Phlebiopsis gigantea (strain 11061_1 CR5-6) TaxID=745531 RepID=A0A0C3PWB7_PHLG1|nr:hypothetical protein PHLGIDRAFT_32902 [Phlebiopsis gigantea 11061_1 CR5-6]